MSKIEIKYTIVYEKEYIFELEIAGDKWKKDIHRHLEESGEMNLVYPNVEKAEYKEVGFRIEAKAQQKKFVRNHVETYKTIRSTLGSTWSKFISKYTYLNKEKNG